MEPLEPLEIDFRLPRTPRRREAEEWALVLQAEGHAVAVVRSDGLFTVAVATSAAERAVASLAAWQAERTLPPPPEEHAAVFRLPSSGEILLAIAAAAGLVAFHLGLERSDRHAELVSRGENQAALVVAGELHRCVTALSLHADLDHVLGNALFGSFFLAILAGRIGLGLALACFVATGFAGNLADALYYRAAHHSIGASTGVFGLVGVLTGLSAFRRHQRLGPRRGAWVSLAAGLAIVAMLGGAGPKVDLAAHLFGLAAGAMAGLALAIPLANRPRPGSGAQLACFALAFGAIAVAWSIAGVAA